MLELRLLLVGLFYCFRALLLRLRGFRGRAVRGVALRGGSRLCAAALVGASGVWLRAAACRGGGVCVSAGANGAAVCGNVRRRGVFVCQRRWRRCGASLRRCAAAGEGPRRAARLPAARMSTAARRRRFRRRKRTSTAAMMSTAAGALFVCCGAVRCELAHFFALLRFAKRQNTRAVLKLGSRIKCTHRAQREALATPRTKDSSLISKVADLVRGVIAPSLRVTELRNCS